MNEIIWWLDQYQIENLLVKVDTIGLPDYIQEQLRKMQGRPLRGRLWVPEGLKCSVDPWNEQSYYSDVCSQCGGIAFWSSDYNFIVDQGGIVTDQKLNLYHPYDDQIFLGAGPFSVTMVKHLHRITDLAITILGGIQQAPMSTEQVDANHAQNIIKARMEIHNIAMHLRIGLCGSKTLHYNQA